MRMPARWVPRWRPGSWQQALRAPLGRRDLSLQADLDQRVRDLDDF